MSRAELDDERSFLLRSLEDLEREHDAGDLSEEDYAVLRDRYTARAAAVLRSLEGDGGVVAPDPRRAARRPGDRATAAGGAAFLSRADTGPRSDTESGDGADGPGRGPRARRGRGLLVGGIGVIVVAAALAAVLEATAPRLPGQTASGSVKLNAAEQLRRTLAQAEAVEAQGNASEALRLYQLVLATDPTQVEALAESGWLEFQAGVRDKDSTVLSGAQQQEQLAEQVDSSASAPHLYLGSMLLTEGNDAAAAGQYRLYLEADPPAAQVRAALPFIDRAFQGAGQKVPPLPAGVTGG